MLIRSSRRENRRCLRSYMVSRGGLGLKSQRIFITRIARFARCEAVVPHAKYMQACFSLPIRCCGTPSALPAHQTAALGRIAPLARSTRFGRLQGAGKACSSCPQGKLNPFRLLFFPSISLLRKASTLGCRTSCTAWHGMETGGLGGVAEFPTSEQGTIYLFTAMIEFLYRESCHGQE